MKLKGKLTKKLSKEDRARKQKTINKMAIRRVEDTVNLRKILELKLKEIQGQKERSIAVLKQVQIQIYKLKGAEKTLSEILLGEEGIINVTS